METRRETDVAGHGQRATDAWRDSPFDVVIVGAGINGAGLARDLALRGIRVPLVDKGDFGSAAAVFHSRLPG